MKRRITVLLALFMIILSGCADVKEEPAQPVSKNTPTETVKTDNSSFGVAFVQEKLMNPLKTKNKQNLELFGLIYEGLFELDGNFEPRPLLCESYTSQGNTYTLSIRSGVTFSDGKELDASDVEYSLRLAKGAESYYSERLREVLSINAVDPQTVEVRLAAPNGRLPQLLDVPIIEDGAGNESYPAGTGCYTVIQDEKTISLSARGDWWRGEAPLYKIIKMYSVGSIDELIYNFESMNIGLITTDSTSTNPVTIRGEFEARQYPTSVMQYLGFNINEELFRNPLVRQAFACLIDRQSAATQDCAGLADPTLLPLHPASAAYREEYAKNLKFSKDNTKGLLDAAGIKDTNGDGKLDNGGRRSKPISISILVNQENKSKIAVCERVAEALGQIGIKAEVREEKWDDYIKALKNGDFDLYYAELNMSADFRMDPLIRGELNYGRYALSNYELLSKFNAAPLVKDSEDVKNFYTYFAEQVPFVPVLFKKYTAITHQKFFDSILTTQQNAYYKFYGWEKTPDASKTAS